MGRTPPQTFIGIDAGVRIGLTGYAGRTNAHMRDAGLLVFGLKAPPPMKTDRELFYAPLSTLESR